MSEYNANVNLKDKNIQVLSVGWLQNGKIYDQGVTSDLFKQKLLLFCLNPLWVTLGYHECDLCGDIESNYSTLVTLENGIVYKLGSTEILVPCNKNIMFIAPDLIYHYVCQHNYLPPQKFIQAVLENPLLDSLGYSELTQQNELQNQEIVKKGVLDIINTNTISKTKYYFLGNLTGITGERNKLLIPIDILEPFSDISAVNGKNIEVLVLKVLFEEEEIFLVLTLRLV